MSSEEKKTNKSINSDFGYDEATVRFDHGENLFIQWNMQFFHLIDLALTSIASIL